MYIFIYKYSKHLSQLSSAQARPQANQNFWSIQIHIVFEIGSYVSRHRERVGAGLSGFFSIPTEIDRNQHSLVVGLHLTGKNKNENITKRNTQLNEGLGKIRSVFSHNVKH